MKEQEIQAQNDKRRCVKYFINLIIPSKKYLIITYYHQNPQILFHSICPLSDNKYLYFKYDHCKLFLSSKFISQYKTHMPLSQDYADVLAGNLAGWAFITVAQPLDYFKTMFQVKHDLPSIKQIYKEVGLKGLYRGASSIYLFSGFITALQFESFQRSLTKYTQWRNEKRSQASVLSLMLAGFTSGAVCSFIFTPIQYSKIQSQVQISETQGSARRIYQLLKKQKLIGFKKLYTGHLVTMLKQSIGSSLYYGSYHITLTHFFKQKRQQAALWTQFLSGGFAGIMNTLYSYPLDTIKTNIQSGHRTGKQMIDSKFWKRANFWKGLRLSLFSSFISQATNFVVYQNFRIFLLGTKKQNRE